MEELLTKFNGLLEDYGKHREYIRRAKAQSQKFSSGIIEKVILDHEVKSSAVADDVLPLVPEIEGAINDIDAEVQSISDGKATADEQMEELNLRLAIGELDDDGFAEAGTELQATLDAANERLSALSADRELLSTALDKWVELAIEAEQDTGTTAAPSGGEHTSTDNLKDDVSAVFERSAEPASVSVSVEIGASDDEAIEAGADDDGESATGESIAVDAGDDEAIEAGEIEAEVDFGFDGDDDDDDGDGDVEVELDLGGAGGGDAVAASEAGDEIGIDLDAVEEAEAEAEEEAAEENRRALLLYQEGTAEEQIYPFTGEVLTVGRGRDNDIQIKNDSKVSRFHCKLFRRNSNFYVEDNKSSNGTLVNGELITERRLFGGEEIIIGETFFRFRIM